ncbi:RTA1-domain-containing protein [Trametopsis cervina]|nr:RTA1-domain-containing protein [Trametopsis cervina]
MASNPTSVHPPTPGHFTQTPYHYIPTEWVCAIFVALYSISGILHLGQAIYTRLWFMIPTAVLACIGEILGWSARLWSAKNPTLVNPFLMQISTTIIAPTPLVAANFVILGELISRFGAQYSRLNAVWYTIVFCSCDVIALVIQAVGGAGASAAVHQGKDPNPGGHVMLAGIAFQLAAITIYVALATEFVFRYIFDRPVRKGFVRGPGRKSVEHGAKLMLVSLALSSVFLFIRSVYRTIELQNGWDGRIISTQVLFNVLDGAMITLATFTMNFLHPGFLLGHASAWYSQGARNRREGAVAEDNESNTTVQARGGEKAAEV